jgi:hypothetical protein
MIKSSIELENDHVTFAGKVPNRDPLFVAVHTCLSFLLLSVYTHLPSPEVYNCVSIDPPSLAYDEPPRPPTLLSASTCFSPSSIFGSSPFSGFGMKPLATRKAK